MNSQMSENSLVIFTKASQMLAEADTIQKAKELKNLALTAADWAKRKGMGEEAIQYCRSYALEAERKMGEMLKKTPSSTGRPGPGRGKKGVPASNALLDSGPTAGELGLTRKQRSEAEELSEMEQGIFEEIKSGKKSKTKARRERKAREIAKKVSLPDAKYRLIYADPPWSYGNTQPDYYTEQRDHYPVMKLSEICSLPVSSICEDNSVLFLWVTSPILEESFQVIKAWGFKYKASFVWDKMKHNMGHYNSVRHEFLLVCVRGSCQPDVPKLFDSVQSIERSEHSKKPEEFYTIIETLYPNGKKIELFARGKRDGWDVFGHEAA